MRVIDDSEGPSRNVWRKVRADRAAVLVDADAYFRAVHHAFTHARQQILIVGWDIDSRVCLRRELDEAGRRRATLGPLLDALVSRSGGPEAYVLSWDFAFIYALEREPFPQLKLGWTTHRKLHFELDNMHPLGASQHQKIVVVDDAVAFVGGLDLCGARWDTPAHRAVDPLRHDPPLKPHEPFHDVQMLVAGDAAAALGDLARDRWFRCTGERIATPSPSLVAKAKAKAPSTSASRALRFYRHHRARREASGPVKPAPPPPWAPLWPAEVTPDFERVDVGIARTEPPFNGRPLVREVEQLHVDAIAKARESIYIENQYFTSHVVAAAIARRLQEPRPPELVLVQPRECSGWLEASTMGVLRRQLMEGLRVADQSGKHLALYYPDVAQPAGTGPAVRVNVHAKVTIIDDTLLRVGSANLSNRSMGYDSECDLVIEAADDDVELRRRIASIRERLLAEHLAVSPERVRLACRASGGLIAGIERVRRDNDGDAAVGSSVGNAAARNAAANAAAAADTAVYDIRGGSVRNLRVLDVDQASWLEPIMTATSVVDPERPIPVDPFVEREIPAAPAPAKRVRAALAVVAVVLALCALGLAWKVTPLEQLLTPDNLERIGRPLTQSAWGPLVGVGVFVVGGLLIVPLSLLTVQSGALFGPLVGFGVAFSGGLASAALSWVLGAVLGQGLMAKVIGRDRLRTIRNLKGRGVLGLAVLRLMPVAPYTVVNLAAGAVRIPFITFMAGTFLGILPGSIVLTLFASGIVAAIRQPSPGFIALVTLGIVALFAASASLVKFVRRRRKGAPPLSTSSGTPALSSG